MRPHDARSSVSIWRLSFAVFGLHSYPEWLYFVPSLIAFTLQICNWANTPLLSWQINKNFDPRTGILHIVRDPQGIPKIPLTRSESSIWGRYSPLKWTFLQRPLQTSDGAENGGHEFVAKFWCVLKKKVPKSDHYFLSYWWAPIIRNGPVDPDNQQVVNSAKFLFMGTHQ